ncbi:25S rRNA (adenine645-N1)-methyltransferase [Aspergillus glaucus CBS 516.65]|uniref:Ribosomal RNA-processing protein 8 n=1 Tax=Aspergillus glaucus CBS 516.65 TaxID=1160497 RepID=A0A1L9VEM9_ASPGL|nr:hypothetical protein ASPGLDRAFT_49123 [Aspergillus glaucus CBS 516.65]OJJ82345.1 hypothetical protein ASPGLDRAFT_49123 [Aspergillus glaucus CBS 516.65]
MFAVPGWSVSNDALKTQSEQPKPKSDDKSDNKRKRGNDHVTKKNVDAMYRQHIEGRKRAPVKKKTEKKNKNQEQKSQNGDASNAQEQQGKDKKEPNGDKEKKPQQQSGADEAKGPDGNEGKPNKKQKKNSKNKPEQPQENADKQATSNETPAATESLPVAPPVTEAKLTPLQQAMRQKLISSRFRHLNETLYTTPSAQALELFSSNPELFNEYHAGFSRQVQESWPSNPVDGYIKAIRSRGGMSDKKAKFDKKRAQQGPPLPRRPNGTSTIADMGCGDAQLARSLTPSADKLKLKLLSYDLHNANEYITKADVSNLPVKDGSVDIAIFCLSLMGTNWVSFVEEAWRVLRGDGKGECWVSEVKSRFGKVVRKKGSIGTKKSLSKSEKKKLKKKQADAEEAGSDLDDAEVYAEDARPTENDETDISSFIEVFRTRGFVLKPESVDKSNKMFVKMEFVKQGAAPSKGKHASVAGAGAGAGKKKFIEKPQELDLSPEEEASTLKPCVYKLR